MKMSRARTLPFLLGFLALSTSALAEECDNPWSGVWDVTSRYQAGESAAAMTFSMQGDQVLVASGPLDEAQFVTLRGSGSIDGDIATLSMSASNHEVGRLVLQCRNGTLFGEGVLFGTPVGIHAIRPPRRSRPPVTHVFAPARYSLQYTSTLDPALRLEPGDTVRTTTLDNEGRDASLVWRGMPGNTLTGPFYVEGALPGDTLVVRLNRVRLNRDNANMFSGAINRRAVQSDYEQTPVQGWGRGWSLDLARGRARLTQPSDRLARFSTPLRPMLGSIGVAPPRNQAIFAGDLGAHGGNLDYNRLVEGVTIYLPVWRPGAHLFLGDGHAAQADGEITGQGLETSLQVEFSVELMRGASLGQVWMEDAEDIMVSGIDNTLDQALQMATTGMARWLRERYQLNDSEIAAVLGTSIEYDIAEVVDPRPHVVARISKAVLQTIRPH